MANPEHMEMQQNIENYRTMAGVETFQLIDQEAKPHLVSSGDPSVNHACGVWLLHFILLKADSYGYFRLIPNLQYGNIFILSEFSNEIW